MTTLLQLLRQTNVDNREQIIKDVSKAISTYVQCNAKSNPNANANFMEIPFRAIQLDAKYVQQLPNGNDDVIVTKLKEWAKTEGLDLAISREHHCGYNEDCDCDYNLVRLTWT